MSIGVCARSWGEGGSTGVYTRSLLNAMPFYGLQPPVTSSGKLQRREIKRRAGGHSRGSRPALTLAGSRTSSSDSVPQPS